MRIAVDFDGTLVHYDGWKGHLHVGEPIPGMVKRVKEWMRDGHEVFILTARANPRSEEYPDHDQDDAIEVVEEWCAAHLGVRLYVTHEKGGFDEFWDDKVVAVIQNTGRSFQEHVLALLEEAQAISVEDNVTYARTMLEGLIKKVESL